MPGKFDFRYGPFFLILFLALIFVFIPTGCEIFDISPSGFGSVPGSKETYSFGEVEFNMRYAPAAEFPVGRDDASAMVEEGFWIAETQVTYELWYEVRKWAEANGYVFSGLGSEGSEGIEGLEPTDQKNEPVTRVSWYDTVVWCNALSEYMELEPVYTYQGELLKDATDRTAGNNAVAGEGNGFRLPTSDEWELAARYRGNDSDHGAVAYPEGSENYWTPWDYASGATASVSEATETGYVAWYAGNTNKTRETGQKPGGGNHLGLYDVSGNVFEWCWEWYPGYEGTRRVNRGGSWSYNAYELRVGSVNCADPGGKSPSHGFRLVRTAAGEESIPIYLGFFR